MAHDVTPLQALDLIEAVLRTHSHDSQSDTHTHTHVREMPCARGLTSTRKGKYAAGGMASYDLLGTLPLLTERVRVGLLSLERDKDTLLDQLSSVKATLYELTQVTAQYREELLRARAEVREAMRERDSSKSERDRTTISVCTAPPSMVRACEQKGVGTHDAPWQVSGVGGGTRDEAEPRSSSRRMVTMTYRGADVRPASVRETCESASQTDAAPTLSAEAPPRAGGRLFAAAHGPEQVIEKVHLLRTIEALRAEGDMWRRKAERQESMITALQRALVAQRQADAIMLQSGYPASTGTNATLPPSSTHASTSKSAIGEQWRAPAEAPHRFTDPDRDSGGATVTSTVALEEDELQVVDALRTIAISDRALARHRAGDAKVEPSTSGRSRGSQADVAIRMPPLHPHRLPYPHEPDHDTADAHDTDAGDQIVDTHDHADDAYRHDDDQHDDELLSEEFAEEFENDLQDSADDDEHGHPAITELDTVHEEDGESDDAA